MPTPEPDELEEVISYLAGIMGEEWPEAAVFSEMPESIQRVPAVIFWLAPGEVPWPRDVTYVVRHTVEVRCLWGRAKAPASDKTARSMIGRLRKRLDASGTMERLRGSSWMVQAAGVTSYRYGVVQFGATQYLGLTLNVRVEVRVIAGEVQ